MLRIKREDEPGGRVALMVEGTIDAGPAGFLESECSDLLGAGAAVSLDLAGVDLVDRKGLAALKRLGCMGVEIRCRCGAVANVLEAEGLRISIMPSGD